MATRTNWKRGSASFSGYKPGASELRVPISGSIAIDVLQVNASRWEAWYRNGGQLRTGTGSLVSGGLIRVQAEVAARFEKQVTPWSWTTEDGNPCEAPAGAIAV
jgi:hypothetical protein